MVIGLRTAGTVQFDRIETTRGVLRIAETAANYTQSMGLLRERHIEPLTYKQALLIFDENPHLKERLRGKGFWLKGEGLEVSGYHTFDEDGTLVKIMGNELTKPPLERTVYTYPGNGPHYMGISYGDGLGGGRFGLTANRNPKTNALAVVGLELAA
ncbi:MAG TPA: hypothetical protein VL945_00960 [Candidatus Saccharimonadales bacterium]|nr:hypothetical protein [Candidatus Saccharimonadales bacterium]